MPDDKSAKSRARDKVQSKLKNLLLRLLPSKAKLKLTAINITCTLTTAGLIMLLAVKAPDVHSAYLRATVGSRVYKIKADLNGGGGTGFQLKAPSGTNYIVTNSHVCEHLQLHTAPENAQTVLVVDDEGNWVRRHIVAVSDKSDICLVEGMPGVDGLTLGSEPNLGEYMTVVGHPHLRPLTLSSGEVIGAEDVKIMDHIVAVKDNPLVALLLPPASDAKCDMPKNEIKTFPIPASEGGGEVQVCFVTTHDAYMTSIVIYPGNSGSPMVNFWGHVVGIAFAADDSDNCGDIVSLSDLQTFIAKY